jgi:CubicO group peptidase (beta-lactamase class C family)
MLISTIIWLVALILLMAIIYYLWQVFPIITGLGAKQLCSGVFVAGRDPNHIISNELKFFPISLGTYTVDYANSSATGTLIGLAKKKAIYRPGLGSTLLNGYSEDSVRSRSKLELTPPFNPEEIEWPMGDKFELFDDTSFDKKILDAAVDEAFVEPRSGELNTRAILVLYDGKIVAEKHADGFNRYSRMLGWSMTKSITGALLGIVADRYKLDVNARAPVAEWSNPNDKRHAITLRHLLQQTSGLGFAEVYTRSSEVTKMLFKKGDAAAFVASRPLIHAPGTVFNYSSGNTNLISRIIRQTIPDEEYFDFPAKNLFAPTGMFSAIAEPDASGTFIGSSYMYATARDWARFGLLYYNDGVFNGKRILPEGWVKESIIPGLPTSVNQYGYQFWLNSIPAIKNGQSKFPAAPPDMFFAEGFEGQRIFIIPSRKLVIVRLGLSRGNALDENILLKNILAAFKF